VDLGSPPLLTDGRERLLLSAHIHHAEHLLIAAGRFRESPRREGRELSLGRRRELDHADDLVRLQDDAGSLPDTVLRRTLHAAESDERQEGDRTSLETSHGTIPPVVT